MKKFSNAFRFTKTTVGKISDDKPSVYRLQNSYGEDLYIGKAKKGRVQERLLEHLNILKEKIRGASRVKIAQVNNLGNAEKLEKTLIKKLNPKFNEVHRK